MQPFKLSQEAVEQVAESIPKASPAFLKDDGLDSSRSDAKVIKFKDQDLQQDDVHRNYLMQIFTVDLETVKLYRLNAQKLRLNEQTRTKLMEEREVLQEKLLFPLNFDTGDVYGAPAEKRQRLD